MGEVRKETRLIVQVAHNIKKMRLRLNLSQQQLGDACGLKISRYESGKVDMTLTTLSILSKHLKIEPYEFLK